MSASITLRGPSLQTNFSLEERLEQTENALQKLTLIANALLEKANSDQDNLLAVENNLSQFIEGFESIATALDELRDRIEGEPRKKADEDNKPSAFICPGHSEFFHRYKGRERAKKKAALEVSRKEKEPYMKHVKYELLDYNTPEGENSGFFGGLNKQFYNYAINIISYHVDDCRLCHFHPNYTKMS
jgi:DNA-binding protein H-NS